MPYPLEYHKVVNHLLRRLIPASLGPLAIFLFPLVIVSSSPAQIGGVPPGAIHSVPVAPPTAVRVAPPTVMLVPPPTGAEFAPGAFPPSGFAHPTGIPHRPHPPQNPGNHPHHDPNGVAIYPYPYPYPVPYGADVSDPGTSGSDDAESQGGQNVGDPSNYGVEAYVRPLPVDPPNYVSAENNFADPPAPDPVADPPQPPTTLVFKDGHQLQLNNYAIVSQTLYDFTPGHPRKIALSDLDLSATQKQNDDHGVVFGLPPSSQTN
jgi:hypothetical protein